MFLVSGIPRSGTTVIAGFLSLDEQLFCYSTETHLLSFLHHHFSVRPCNKSNIDAVTNELNRHLTSSLIEAPAASINRGYGHQGYALIDSSHIKFIISEVSSALTKGVYGFELFKKGLSILEEVFSGISSRQHKGEKTPDNLFAIANYGLDAPVDNFVVIREPFGTLLSMQDRIKNNYPHSEVFKGSIEYQIGLYLRYADAAHCALKLESSHRVAFEDVAHQPQESISRLYAVFNRKPSAEILDLVQHGGRQEVADRAPMKYRKPLRVKTDLSTFSLTDLWKINLLTKHARESIGYDDTFLKALGLVIPTQSPGNKLETKLVAMSGFHFHDNDGEMSNTVKGLWSSGQSKLIAYLEQFKSYRITLEVLTLYPDKIITEEQVILTTLVNGNIQDEIKISAGLNQYSIDILLSPEDLLSMDKSAYAILDINCSSSFCPLIDSIDSADIRRLAFQIVDWNIS